MRIDPSGYRILEYVTGPSAVLRRDEIAKATYLTPASVSVVLARLTAQGLITIKRGRHNKYVSITPNFDHPVDRRHCTVVPTSRKPPA